jgi:sugar phosphate isomerase/epimerase
MIKRSFLVLTFALLAAAAACREKPAPEPTFAICGNVAQWPAMAAAGYDDLEPRVGDVLVPGESDSVFLTRKAQVEAVGARLVSCTIFLPGQFRVVGTETNHDDILVWAETSFRRAQQLGIPMIVLGSGRTRTVADGFSRERAREQFIDLCRRLGPLAQQYGVTVVVEPLNRGETNFINSLAEGADIVEATDHPNIRLLCDIFHMSRENEPASEIARYGHLIRHVHIAEKADRTAPGTVGDDFTPYFAALKEIGYAGCISIEGNFDRFETRIGPALQTLKEQYAAAGRTE